MPVTWHLLAVQKDFLTGCWNTGCCHMINPAAWGSVSPVTVPSAAAPSHPVFGSVLSGTDLRPGKRRGLGILRGHNQRALMTSQYMGSQFFLSHIKFILRNLRGRQSKWETLIFEVKSQEARGTWKPALESSFHPAMAPKALTCNPWNSTHPSLEKSLLCMESLVVLTDSFRSKLKFMSLLLLLLLLSPSCVRLCAP